MPTIKYDILIDAPIEYVFDLTRDVDVHMQTTANTGEQAIAGVTHGLMEKGDTVTWKAKHLGVKQTLTAKIIEMNRPYYFKDIMIKGAFHSFTHTHEFIETDQGTLMKDVFQYQSPLGFIGVLADQLFLEKYMQRFIERRAIELKKIAEMR
ncbi:SRPBCC family protein [Piscibacillus halophilus]|uniref:Ligand-binding SRPBCC domain-containing protein n=1 Tax=Piscibacillus halophilus TaxID=571933 RepID=A0A1H9IY40_9BACI|nr:SRPBCC family protein [Piscibacillus halophilus]SEQ79442.1 Ligand-binding SRPBCC domain-containing protein [Piscibacillus halophilus]